MNRFWARFTKPILETVRPARVIEIGAESGWNTRRLLEHCREHGIHADIVDPAPLPSLLEILAAFPESHALHRATSLEVLPLLEPHDLVLLDGDHNWYTVYHELGAIFARADLMKVEPPIILAHDCAWPYARRDMYYNPDTVPQAERHPYAHSGLVPGNPGLSDSGMNSTLANAIQEGGPRNGVLTAFEDFIAGAAQAIDFRVLPFFNGMGILVPHGRMTPALKVLLDSFLASESLLETCRALEEDGMRVRAESWELRSLLARRTDALQRARILLAERGAELAVLNGSSPE